MKAVNEFKDKTTAINQLWQTDFTYLKIIGWGWVYLSTILDNYSRYIVSWKLCSTMKSRDAIDTIELALQASDCDKPHIKQKPRLLADNGASYVLSEFANYLDSKNIKHTRGVPYHPQTHGKIERWHQTLKNKLTPADVYFGRGQEILNLRERIKAKTIQKRRLRHQMNAA